MIRADHNRGSHNKRCRHILIRVYGVYRTTSGRGSSLIQWWLYILWSKFVLRYTVEIDNIKELWVVYMTKFQMDTPLFVYTIAAAKNPVENRTFLQWAETNSRRMYLNERWKKCKWFFSAYCRSSLTLSLYYILNARNWTIAYSGYMLTVLNKIYLFKWFNKFV